MNIHATPAASAEFDQCQANMRQFFVDCGVDFDDPATRDAIGTAFAYLAHGVGTAEGYRAAAAAILALRWA